MRGGRWLRHPPAETDVKVGVEAENRRRRAYLLSLLPVVASLLIDGKSGKVRAVGILLFLGIGSFVCYKLFRRLKLIRKKCDCDLDLFEAFKSSQWVSEELLSKDTPSDDECVEEKYFGPESFRDSDTQSRISDTSQSLDTDCNSGSWGDREFTSDSPQLSDSGEEIMGITASNHCIPVFFNKTNGVFFNYHPKAHQCDSSLAQNLASPLFDPSSSVETSFLPKNFQHSKPKCSPNRNIYVGNKNESICRYKSKFSPNEDSYSDRLLEESLQMVCNSDLETDTSLLSLHWDQDQDILSTCDSFSFDESAKFQETSSLRANFSPASLQERYLKAESYFLRERSPPNNLTVDRLNVDNNEKCGVLSDSHVLYMKRDASSADSLSNISDQLFVNNKQVKRLFHQDISIDSETSDFSLDLQPQTTELGYQTVGQLEQLQNQLCEVKKAVQELDKEFVELKIYETPPKHSWELSVISPSDVDHSSGSENEKYNTSNVATQNYEDAFCKISSDLLENSDKPRDDNKSFGLDLSSMPSDSGQCLKQVPVPSFYQSNIETRDSNQIDATCKFVGETLIISASETKTQTKNLDSGSDFGNSLESELGEICEITRSCSLEWDPMCLPECASTLDCSSFPSPTDTLASLSEFIHDQEIVSPLSESESKDIKDFQDCNSFKKYQRSHSIPSEMFTGGIKNSVIKKNLLKRSITLPYCKKIKIENSSSLYQKQIDHFSIMSDESFSLKYQCENSLYNSEESGFLDTQSMKKSETNTLVNEMNVCSTSSNSLPDNLKEKTKYLMEDDNGNTFVIERESTSNIDSMNISVNRDSAYCEGSTIDNYLIKNIGDKQNLIEYSLLAWEGETLKNKQIRKGYKEIAETFGFKHLRVIRRDNYCAIRAALFQVLSRGLPVTNRHGSAKMIYQKLERWTDECYPWLTEWNFGDELSYDGDTCLPGFYRCLRALQAVEEELRLKTEAEEHLARLLNGDPRLDVHLMQAAKILMMVTAIELHRSFVRNDAVPVFAVALFARRASPSLRQLLSNRLNRVGHATQMDEVEMCLLGYSLSVVLRVVRSHRCGRRDFLLFYPEKDSHFEPEVTLIAENDGRYNVPTG